MSLTVGGACAAALPAGALRAWRSPLGSCVTCRDQGVGFAWECPAGLAVCAAFYGLREAHGCSSAFAGQEEPWVAHVSLQRLWHLPEPPHGRPREPPTTIPARYPVPQRGTPSPKGGGGEGSRAFSTTRQRYANLPARTAQMSGALRAQRGGRQDPKGWRRGPLPRYTLSASHGRSQSSPDTNAPPRPNAPKPPRITLDAISNAPKRAPAPRTSSPQRLNRRA